MQRSFCCDIGRACFFGRIKSSESLAPAVGPDSSNPRARLLFPIEFHAEISSFVVLVWRSAVLHVLRMGREPEIDNSVVRSAPVDMVNLQRRKLAIHIQPRKPLAKVAFPVKANVDITLVGYGSGNVPDLGPIRKRALPPGK